MLDQAAIGGRERRGIVAVDIEFTHDFPVHEYRHDNLRFRFDRTGEVAWIVVDIVDYDGLPGRCGGSADSLVQRNARVRRHAADKLAELQYALACCGVFLSLWIEKGLGLVVTGFVPSPLETITDYVPTGPEVAITIGIWALGFLLITLLYKVFVAVRQQE